MDEIYDKAKYHLEGDFPEELHQVQAYVLTGFYMGWLADRGMFSEDVSTGFGADVEAFKARSITSAELYKRMGGVLESSMLSQEADKFTHLYFDFENGQYLDDYDELLAADLPSLYHVAATWENYAKISARIQQRYDLWIAQNN